MWIDAAEPEHDDDGSNEGNWNLMAGTSGEVMEAVRGELLARPTQSQGGLAAPFFLRSKD